MVAELKISFCFPSVKNNLFHPWNWGSIFFYLQLHPLPLRTFNFTSHKEEFYVWSVSLFWQCSLIFLVINECLRELLLIDSLLLTLFPFFDYQLHFPDYSLSLSLFAMNKCLHESFLTNAQLSLIKETRLYFSDDKAVEYCFYGNKTY